LEIYKFYSNGSADEKIESSEKRILFCGRISPYKGIEYLVEGYKIAREKIKDLKLTIAGKGNFYFDTKDIINDSSVEIINRYIPNEELTQLIKKSLVIVCPYTDATQSGVIMTAFAFNKPVIASEVGGMIEVVSSGKNGELVPSKNPQAIADAIIKVINEIKKYGNNFQNISPDDKLSWQKIAQQTVDVYTKAIIKQKR
jgi:glycosyltransferase involved in cell wall biosynthesis